MGDEAVDGIWLRAVIGTIGGSAVQLEPLLGGTVNHTYRVDRTSGNPVVLRFPVDPLRPDEFPVETWAARAAARAGIPTAEPLAHGTQAGIPFSLSTYIAPDARPALRPWSWLGAYARILSTVPVHEAPPSLYSRFGANLPAAWAAHLNYNLDALGPHDVLHRDGAYQQVTALRSMFTHLANATYGFGVAHGDLAPRNLISCGPGEPPVLIDWGAAETGPSPWTDARRVFEWWFIDAAITRQDYDNFVEAAGLDSDTVLHELALMTALHLIDVTRWALDNRADLYGEYLDRCRNGLDLIERLV